LLFVTLIVDVPKLDTVKVVARATVGAALPATAGDFDVAAPGSSGDADRLEHVAVRHCLQRDRAAAQVKDGVRLDDERRTDDVARSAFPGDVPGVDDRRDAADEGSRLRNP